MSMIKKLAILAIVAMTFGATAACGSSSGTDTAASSTTAAPSSTTTTEPEEEDETTTTTEDEEDEKPRTKVTKPAKVEKIDPSELPEEVQSLPTSELGISTEEEDCVYTVLFEYSSDPSNPTDDATMAGVFGGAMAACIDQDKIATIITDSVAAEAPNLDADQLSCIEAEIAGTDTDSLAIFLGAFLYEGPEAAELQQPFIDALDQACGLSS